jgi:acyl carrier protein
LAARWDLAALRVAASAGLLPAVLRGLVRDSVRRPSTARASLASRLAKAPESEWEGIAADLVRDHVAAVLRHTTSAAVDLQRPFKDAGFDSLGALELRNRLSQAAGLKLPATLVFDHPTPAAVASFLLAQATTQRGAPRSIDEEIDKLEKMLAADAGDGPERERIGGRLRALLAKGVDDEARRGAVTAEMIEAASPEELVDLIQLDLSEA